MAKLESKKISRSQLVDGMFGKSLLEGLFQLILILKTNLRTI